MSAPRRSFVAALLNGVAALPILSSGQPLAASAAEIGAVVDAALKDLYDTEPVAKSLREKAAGVLVFPNLLKAGFGVGGSYGDGALRVGDRTAGNYAASFGLQAGIHGFSYARLFRSDAALQYRRASDGWDSASARASWLSTPGWPQAVDHHPQG